MKCRCLLEVQNHICRIFASSCYMKPNANNGPPILSSIACCRKSNSAMQEVKLGGGLVLEGVDVTSPAGIEAIKSAVGDRQIDILINNAGILTPDSAENVADKVQDLRDQFEVNSIGPLLLTLGLRSNLREGSKVAIVSSRMGSVGGNISGGMYGYRMSKAAVNCAGMCLHNDLSPSGVSVGLFHPGFVATDMTARHGDAPGRITPETSATGLLTLITRLGKETSGTFASYNGDVIPW
jgi:NAD(P)-dependent dehydrogenase (short-subunit alcohol dehydrogenase family)